MSPAPITPKLLHDLVTYAQARVEAGEASELLAAFGAAIPDLVKAYRIGHLPEDYRSALPTAARKALRGLHCGRSLIMPALDPSGQVVDVLVVKGNPDAPHVFGFWPEPQGLLAPELLHGQASITITDCMPWLVRLWGHGHRDVLLLRGPADARANAARIAAAGVRQVEVRCHRNARAYADALRAAGIQVTVNSSPVSLATVAEPNAPSPRPPAATVTQTPSATEPLNFVEEERDGQVVIAQAGQIRYAISMREDGLTTRRVIVRAHGKSCQHDLDLAVPTQRERTARNIAQQVGLRPQVIDSHLVDLLGLVQQREAARARPATVSVSAAERVTADTLLNAPNLLDLVVDDLTALGWIGETRSKQVLYLTAISRMLPDPVWTVFQASTGAAPWQSIGAIVSLLPAEDTTVFHRLTGAVVAHADRTAFNQKVLVLDQAEALRPDAALALRVLKERGGAGWTANGGATAVLAAASGALDVRCRDSFLTVTVDESPEQTERILAEQRHRQGLVIEPATIAAIQARHQAAQRSLERLPVIIPFVDRIIFPATRVRHRDEQRWFLSLVSASALLHQRQRQRDHDAVVATEQDFQIAVTCTAGLIGQDAGGLGAHARRLLGALTERTLNTFTMADLATVYPEWTRWTFRAALQDLLDFGYVTSPRSERGKTRRFTLTLRTSVTTGDIRLRPLNIEPVDTTTTTLGGGGLAEAGGNTGTNAILVRTGT